MSGDARSQLESELNAALAHHEGTTSRMGVLCELSAARLSVDGAVATVLSHRDTRHGGTSHRGNGNGSSPRRGLVYATDDVSAGLEDVQLTVGEGPGLDAFSSGGPVLVADLSAALVRWPGFTPEALDLGAAAMFSFPLHVGVAQLGSLDFHRGSPTPLSAVESSEALILADLATEIVLHELEGRCADDASWLANPHTEVHQATGMVQVQLQASTETALLRLRAHAYTHELSLGDVAREVVARRLRFTPGPEDAEPDTPT